MSKPTDIEQTRAGTSPGDPAAAETKSELAKIESPPLTPQIGNPKTESAQPASAPEAPALRKWGINMPRIPSLTLSRRVKQRGLMAATVIFAAGIGAAIGAITSQEFGAQPTAKPDAAAIAERQATQKAIMRLNAEISTLKANIETVNRNAGSQIAKITDRFERAARVAPASPETTGSVLANGPAATESNPPAKPVIVEGWFVREARDGHVLVEGRGELYQVVPGAPLPGLGRVETIKRQDGRWIVVTPKGIITSMRTRPVN